MRRSLGDWAGNIFALVVVIAVNALANILQFGGNTTGAVSAKYHSLFTPAGFTFMIWALIYLLLAAFVVYQSLPSQRENEALARVSAWFKVGCVANTLWMFTWHLEWIMVALLLIVLLLYSLARIYASLGVVDDTATAGGRWFVQLPFSVYLGWVAVATIANASAMQAALGWNDLGLDAVAWTLAKIVLAGMIGAWALFRRRDIAFALTVAWAAWGIAAGQAATPAVAHTATALAILLLLHSVSVGAVFALQRSK